MHEAGSTIQQFLNLATFLPPQYLSRQLVESGTLYDWQKYYIHLAVLSPGGIHLAPTHPAFTMQGFCARVVSRFYRTLVGRRIEDNVSRFRQRIEMCKNERCPVPFGAGFVRVKRTDTPYCGKTCSESHSKATHLA
ncbi:unnamed protein product [Rhizoctonia solani]|nr:unnamed protein product [Rhizoctonia solani]